MNFSAISRRDFCKTAATAALTPLILTGCQTAPKHSPNAKVNIGIIGTGGRGRAHTYQYLKHHAKTHIVAICDVNANNIAKTLEICKKTNGSEPAAYGDYRELLAREDIDAVSIAVPDHWHALIAVAAAKAGKHIYSEKPFAYSIVEGRAMVEAAQKNRILFQHGTQQRSGKEYRLAIQLARNGYLGNVDLVQVGAPYGRKGGSTEVTDPPKGLDYDFWLGPAPKVPYTPGRCDGSGGDGWYQIRDYCGGWMTAWGSHDVDIAHWGIDKDGTTPIQVEGTGEVPEEGVYDTYWKWHAEAAFADGKKVIYATENEHPHGVRFVGDENWVFVKRGLIEASDPKLLETKFSDHDLTFHGTNDHFENFIDAIRDGVPLNAPIEAAFNSTATCHLFNIALDTGRSLQWNPKKERFIGDIKADALLHRKMRNPWSLA